MRTIAIAVTAALLTVGCLADPSRTVILNPDGTWRYANAPPGQPQPARHRSVFALATIKGARVPYEVWFDERKWAQLDQPSHQEAEYSFRHSSGDAAGNILATRVVVNLEDVGRNWIATARQRGVKDMKLVSEEPRLVNGMVVKYLHLEGTTRGIPAAILVYVHSSSRGTVEVQAFTGQSLLNELRRDLEELLDGLVITN